jgi:1-acyl-sn-glycerol-3-phosphate acyltransferase
MNGWFYAFAKAVMRVFFALVYPLRMVGAENLPGSGAAILCGNHMSLLDPLAAGRAVGRPVRFMGKKELFKVPLLKGILRALGAFPVDRGNADMTAVRTSLAILKEGGREMGGYRGMETGVALIALKSGAPVVPMRIMKKFRPFTRNTLIIGEPVDLGAYSIRSGSEALTRATERIESAVAALGAPGGEKPQGGLSKDRKGPS